VLDIPRELNILDAMPRQHAAKKAIARQATDSSEPPVWLQTLLPIVGMALAGGGRNNSTFETPRATPPQPPIAGSSRQSALIFDPPSSGTKRAASIAAPAIGSWLLSLDQDLGDRGRHGCDFQQYHLKFDENAVYDLTDMEDLDAAALITLLDCPVGVANRIVKYAKEDMRRLTNTVKRARH
jgi:hypothetical protein